MNFNRNGFNLLGVDFASDYGTNISGCFVFKFKNHEISCSTGAKNSEHNMRAMSTDILIIDPNGEDHTISGTVEDAINFILNKA